LADYLKENTKFLIEITLLNFRDAIIAIGFVEVYIHDTLYMLTC